METNVNTIVQRLKDRYPNAFCSLEYDTGDGGEIIDVKDHPYRLLVMARLSAQCTDARVNIVSRELFKKYPTLTSLAEAEITELERAIFSCGLYKTKSRDIKAMCVMLADRFGGKVPDSMGDLLSLPGVGRKIANLIRGDMFHLPAIVTDTHCIRIAKRLGLTTTETPLKTERELEALIEPSESSDFCHRLVLFGREFCKSQSPRCGECFLFDVCAEGDALLFL